MPDFAAAALFAILSSTQPVPVAPPVLEPTAGVLAAALHELPVLARSARVPQGAPATRDSFKNGAIIGAVVGAVAGAYAGAGGCAAGSILSMSEETDDCNGPVLLGALIFAGLGAGIGVGIDALFEQAPVVPGAPGGRRRGVRLHFRF